MPFAAQTSPVLAYSQAAYAYLLTTVIKLTQYEEFFVIAVTWVLARLKIPPNYFVPLSRISNPTPPTNRCQRLHKKTWQRPTNNSLQQLLDAHIIDIQNLLH